MTAAVKESTVYENLVEETGQLRPDQPPPPPKGKTDYPHTLKVHLKCQSDCDKFARLVRRTLRSDQKSFVFTEGSRTKPENWVFIEKRKHPAHKNHNYRNRLETKLWGRTTDFTNDEIPPYITFKITFRSEKQYIAFTRLVKHRLSLESSYMWFPRQDPESVKGLHWVSRFEDKNPQYPVYIVSKGRADSRLTSRSFERMGVPYYIVIEPQDYDDYACLIDEDKILVAPFSNHGDGPGRARNWCWDHAISLGAKRHWVLDDNIDGFYRLFGNRRVKVSDGGIFRIAEEFVDRFENVPLAGFQYNFFIAPKSGYPPFILNTRIYSCLLIDNSCRHRWRGRYNEDTDLSLRILKDGDCTIQFNEFLQAKVNTQVLGGGNTAEFYAHEGTWNKSIMLEVAHPDVAKVVWRYGRWHHEVNYRPFKDNKPILRAGAEDNPLRFDMELVSEK